MNGFPEIGMKVSSIVKDIPSTLLSGNNDEIFKDVAERELKVQIIVGLELSGGDVCGFDKKFDMTVARLHLPTVRETSEDTVGDADTWSCRFQACQYGPGFRGPGSSKLSEYVVSIALTSRLLANKDSY